MKYILLITLLFTLVISCKKEGRVNTTLKEGIISHIASSDCGYLLWVDTSMYKMVNESVVYDICENRMYTGYGQLRTA